MKEGGAQTRRLQSAAAREDFLRAYVTTYLSEEIKAESLVCSLGSFSRFLQVSAMAAGQRTNVSSIARDAGVSRDTVRGYFEVLVDTLIGTWLPVCRPRAKVKEVVQPKFFWFDPGVVLAIGGIERRGYARIAVGKVPSSAAPG